MSLYLMSLIRGNEERLAIVDCDAGEGMLLGELLGAYRDANKVAEGSSIAPLQQPTQRLSFVGAVRVMASFAKRDLEEVTGDG